MGEGRLVGREAGGVVGHGVVGGPLLRLCEGWDGAVRVPGFERRLRLVEQGRDRVRGARLAVALLAVQARGLDPLLAVLVGAPQGHAAGPGHEQHHCRRQHQLHTPPLPPLGRFGLGRGAVEFRLPCPRLGLGAEVGDGRRHFPGRRRAVGRLRAQAPLAQVHQLRLRAAVVEPRQAVGQVALRRLHPRRLRRVPLERRAAGEDDREHGAEAEHVAAGRHLVGRPGRLLGRHVRRRPHHRAGLRVVRVRVAEGAHLRVRRGGVRVGGGAVGPAADAEHLGQPPVHHLHLAEGADHDVRGLEVAVDHVVGVGVPDGLAHRLEHGHEPAAVVGRVAAGAEEVVEGVALDELHRQKRAAVGEGAEVVDRGDAGVLELAGDVSLVGEPAGDAAVRGELRLEELDRHLAAEGGVGGAEDGAHAAAGDLGAEDVPAARRRRDDARREVVAAASGRVRVGRPRAEFGRVVGHV
ncbi:MAG: hypothetical protein U0804_19725 [Gemmataceae bacterium]